MNFLESVDDFLSAVAKQRLTTYDGNMWEFYDVGDRKLTPLVCLPGVLGGPLIFHRVVSALQQHGGYRVIAVQHPVVWSHEEWVHSFDRFLDALNVKALHIYGVCLGAFLAQRYSSTFPGRVLSLALTNGFCNTELFGANTPCVKMLPILPIFYLRRYVLAKMSFEESSENVKAAMRYMRSQLGSLTQQQLASRLTLASLSSDYSSWRKRIAQERMTFIDSYASNNSFTTDLRQQMDECYPDAKKALMKSAGDFPYLSHHEEVILHLRVHLRAHGLSPQDLTIAPFRK